MHHLHLSNSTTEPKAINDEISTCYLQYRFVQFVSASQESGGKPGEPKFGLTKIKVASAPVAVRTVEA